MSTNAGTKNALPVHFDCDPGQDDAIALLYALGSGTIDICSISVVGGNADVQKCARNALQILDLAGQTSIPVHVGASAPLKRLLQTLPQVFGESGMAGAENLPPPSTEPTSQDAVGFMMNETLPKIWVATGPLTNLALAFQQEPKLVAQIDHLIIMGGCAYPEHIHGWMGNYQVPGTDGYAEYNFAVDPEAAKIVLSAGIEKISMIGVNVTRTVLFNGRVETALRNIGNACGTVAANILATVGPEDHEDYADCKEYPHDPVRGMHDVMAMAYVARPDLFKTETLPLSVVTSPSPAVAGQTLIDHENPDHASVIVITDLDRNGFLETLVDYVGALS